MKTELRARIRQQEVGAQLGRQALEDDGLDQLLLDTSAAVAETLPNGYCKLLALLPGGDEVYLGRGVGRALCQRVPERHGDIWADSEHSEAYDFYVTPPIEDEPYDRN